MKGQVEERAADLSLDELKEKLWTNAKQRNWQQVIKLYKDYPHEAQTAKVTRSGDTALRMAVADEQEYAVEELVKLVEIETLRIKNKLGNTALHLAAYLGNVRMCRSIASKDARLMGIRNNADETPMFVAAMHGRKEAFLCMYRLCRTDEERHLRNTDYSRGKNGRTILHAAISGEHFDLAYQIIHLYPKLVNRFDNWGFLPLHLLARKPLAFKSGCPMGFLHKLTYCCIPVKKLKFVPQQDDEDKPMNSIALNLQRLRIWGPRGQKTDAEDPPNEEQSQGLVPKNYGKRFRCLTLVSKGMEAILWLGSIKIGNIIDEKKKHTWSFQIMDKLLQKSRSNCDEYGGNSYPSSPKKDADGGTLLPEKTMVGLENVDQSNPKRDEIVVKEEAETENEKKKLSGNVLKETPLLVAAKNGILEMVKMILEKVPVAIHDVNIDDKNIVLLSVEYRQPHIYQFILDRKILTETIFYKTDKDGNSALHLAAVLSDERNWNIPGPALHMQWEIKWYQFVEKSMPPRFFVRYNEKGETPWYIFQETHTDLVFKAGKWLSKTSDSCSVVSILIATVAFAAYATVPGGLNSDTGVPVLEKEMAFHVFAISSLIALCFSVSSVVMFLVFFTSRYREKDFATNLPTKLVVELSSLMVAVAALLVSFCAAHSLMIRDSLKYTAFPLYAATLLPVALYAFWQIPTYFEFAYATFQETPQRIYNYN